MESILGPKLKHLRTTKQVSLKGLAKKLRVNQAHLSRIETGKVVPSEPLLRKICRVVKGDYEELAVLSGRLPGDVRRVFSQFPKEACALLRQKFPTIGGENGNIASAPRQEKYRVVDLFAGAGGFTRGFVDSGRFTPVFANDYNEWAAKTYNENFGKHCLHGDINELFTNKDFEFPKDVDVVVGGPPCQGFSLLNKNREKDPRKNLTLAYMKFVERVRPKVFVMENVPEMLGSAEYREIEKQAEALGYTLTSDILNAADFGVGQRRKRAIVVATQVGLPELPHPTHIDPAKKSQNGDTHRLPWVTVKQKIADLPAPVGSEIRRDEESPLDIHFGRTPTEMSKKRYRCVPEGGNRFDLQRKRPDLTPDCWIRKTSGGTDLFGRLWWGKPAFTIRTEFYKPEKGRYLHPEQHRPITHREAARLQSFPDDFKFEGTKIQIAIQIGNAVPPLLGQAIAESVASCLDAAAVRPPAHRSAR